MLTIRRKCITLALVLLSGLSAWPWLAWGQSYPSKPITLIIPFPPGGPTDVTGRVLAEKLSLALKQQVVVDNRAGASGNVGAVAAARAAPDGYTLFFATGGTHGINPSLYRNAGFDPIRDFAPVAWITVSPNIIVVHPSFPATTVKVLIDLAKANPDKYSSAAPGQGSTPHMAGELFKRAAGIAIVHVPYKGSGPALNDVIGGHIPIMFDGIPSAMPHIRAGRLRALGVTSLQRVPTAPDIPTVAETLPGFEANGWFALFAPAGTPTEIVNKLNAEVNRILDQPDVKQRYAGLGAITVGGPPEKLRDQVKAEVERWGELIRATQMKVE